MDEQMARIIRTYEAGLIASGEFAVEVVRREAEIDRDLRAAGAALRGQTRGPRERSTA